ncbi:hypothetical protein N7540_006392 [Penicillium herquei]|nr:hypothetical protein N7540_006392 [Penicillium herquei]
MEIILNITWFDPREEQKSSRSLQQPDTIHTATTIIKPYSVLRAGAKKAKKHHRMVDAGGGKHEWSDGKVNAGGMAKNEKSG